MTWLLIALLSTITFGTGSFLMKVAIVKRFSYGGILLGLYLPGSLLFAVAVQFESAWAISVPIAIASFLIGSGSLAGNIAVLRALQVGPASLTIPMINLNLVLIILMSVFIFQETLTAKMLTGVALLIIATSLIAYNPKENTAIRSISWYWLVLLAIIFIFMRNGGLKVTQEIGINNNLVLFYGYAGSALISSIQALISNIRHTSLKSVSGLNIGLAIGMFSFAGLYFYAYALSIGPASIVVPIYSTYSLISAILSIIFYKEKLSFPQKIALICVFVGLILVT